MNDTNKSAKQANAKIKSVPLSPSVHTKDTEQNNTKLSTTDFLTILLMLLLFFLCQVCLYIIITTDLFISHMKEQFMAKLDSA